MKMVRFIVVSMVVHLMTLPNLHSQESGVPLRRAIVFRPNQEAISGRLIRVGDNSLVVLTLHHEEEIMFEDISRVILSGESRSSKGVIHGALLGGYAVTALVGATDSKPTGYLRRDYSSGLGILVILIPSVFAGGGIGYLLDPGTDGREEMFDFTGSHGSQTAERKRLQNELKDTKREHGVHISVQGSQIFPSVVKAEESQSSYWGGYGYEVSDFNVLRRLQVTYSILPNVEVGLASVWFGEPSHYHDLGEWSQSGYSRWGGTLTSLDAVGRHLVVVYKPFPESLDGRYELAFGSGIGISSIQYQRNTSVNETVVVNNVSTTSYFNSPFEISETMLSGFVYAQASMKLTENLSLGLIFDYIVAPSKEAPADVRFGIPKETLNFGNTSIGFTFEYQL